MKRWLASLPIAIAIAMAPAAARAHFMLQAPDCASVQDASGSPQKVPPCGDDGSSPTGKITTFRPGETINITIDETVTHPGHYRVALAVKDKSELPADPPVTPGSTACGSVPIDPSPKMPLLADGMLVHTKSFDGPQTMQVRLPTNVTCEKCTLQVIEFMSQHSNSPPGGCFYHHCATIAIKGAQSDGTPPPVPAGSGTGQESSGGCALSLTSPSEPVLAGLSPAILFTVVALVRAARARGRAPSPPTPSPPRS